jgi:hypothetical protein
MKLSAASVNELDALIYFEDRNGYPYYIVTGPDGQSHGFWHRELARAVAQTVIDLKTSAEDDL